MNSRVMLVWWSSYTMVCGQATPEVKTKIDPASAKVEVMPVTEEQVVQPLLDPAVEISIPAAVKLLAKPKMFNFSNGVLIAVTSASERVQAHVNQGLNHLHGGWDFEASRHFAAAMREDPECLLAQWGMVMSLLTPSVENGSATTAAASRLLDLLDKGNGTPLERGYGYALVKFIQKGSVAGADAFRKVSGDFPNDPQSRVFTALFSRGGYDEFGIASPDQVASEKMLRELIAQDPTRSLPLHALLSIRADAPDLADSLDSARKLCALTPNYPPYLHLLGHYEWRCGEHARAIEAFTQAAAAYQSWMVENKVTLADCPAWVKSESYRIVALESKGDSTAAYEAAVALALLSVPPDRLTSPGQQALVWDAKSLPARLLMNQNKPGAAALALKSLGAEASLAKQTATTAALAEWWNGGLAFALDTLRLIEMGDLDQAQAVLAAFTRHGDEMAKTRKAASLTGEISAWNRSFRGLNILASDLRGRLVLAGPVERRGTAYNWFSSAAERQTYDGMMFPPVILTPMHREVGEFYLSVGRATDAVESYQRALAAFPNDSLTLEGLKKAYEMAKLPADALRVSSQIEALHAP